MCSLLRFIVALYECFQALDPLVGLVNALVEARHVAALLIDSDKGRSPRRVMRFIQGSPWPAA